MEYTPGLTTIIIGCYNVASWLSEKRLSCILQQTWSKIEVLLVDDGSTDATPALLQELSQEDSRIRIITKENGGLGSARNAGLDAARGEYIWFYDVDDEAEPHLVEKNVEWMSSKGTDLNVFSYFAITPATRLKEEVRFDDILIESNEALHDIFLDKLFFIRYGNGFAWNKFYRRSFLESHGIRFGNQRIQQDELFNLQIYPLIDRVYISDTPLYNYFIYEKGNTRSHYIPDRYSIYLSIYNGINQFSKRWKIDDQRLNDHAIKRLYEGMSQSIVFNTFHPDSPLSSKEKKEEIIRILQHPESKMCMDYMQSNAKMGMEQRLFLKAFRLQSPLLIKFLRRIYNCLRTIHHWMRTS